MRVRRRPHARITRAAVTSGSSRPAPPRTHRSGSFFFFDESLPHGYECWAGVPSLPKLDYGSLELRTPALRRPGQSSCGTGSTAPIALDGWRIDVRQRDRHGESGIDLTADVARRVRAAVVATRPDAVLVAEHDYDARGDLRGDGWHGLMNYPGFTRPVWCVAPRRRPPATGRRSFVGASCRSSATVRGRGRRQDARLPRRRAVAVGAALVGHARQPRHRALRDRAGSRERQLVGIGMQMTTPGRADGVRRRRDRARGRLGGGRAAPDAVVDARDLGHGAARRVPPPDLAAPVVTGASRAAGSATRTWTPTRSRTCGRAADERVLCLARRRAGEPLRLRARTRSGGERSRRWPEGQTERPRGGRSGRAAGRRARVPGLEDRVRGRRVVAEVVLKDVDKVYDNGFHAVKDLSLEIEDGEFLVLVGPVGLRQDDGPAHGRRAGADHRRHGRDRRPRRQRPVAEGPRHRDGVPELRALPAPERRRQHRLRPAAAEDAEARGRASAWRGRPSCSTSRRTSTASRSSSPAGSASASRWAGRSSGSRRSS